MPAESVLVALPRPVTPAAGEGALGTWRFRAGPGLCARLTVALNAGTSFARKPRRPGACSGSAGSVSAPVGRRRRDSQGQNRIGEIPPSGMKWGACGNVGVMGAGLRPIRKLMDMPPYPTMLRALHLYPNP